VQADCRKGRAAGGSLTEAERLLALFPHAERVDGARREAARDGTRVARFTAAG